MARAADPDTAVRPLPGTRRIARIPAPAAAWLCLLAISAGGSGRVMDRAEAVAQSPAEIIAACLSRDRLPSISAAIRLRGRAEAVTAAAGLADIENTVPASADTVYRVGSTAKPVTAAAVLQLAEMGRLDMDRPVQAYCPAFPGKGVVVTPRLLLAHLGGLRHYDYQRFAEEVLSGKRYHSTEEALEKFKNDPLSFPPGEKHAYSSYGYVLLGCAVEGAAGMPFVDYLEKNIFGPAGMPQTRPDVPEALIPRRARTYSAAKDGAWFHSPHVDLSDRIPAGGLLSTPRDLAAFGAALQEGKLIAPETWEAMITPQKTSSGETTAYGLGWRLSGEPGEVFHGGTSVGGSALLYIRAGTGTVVALAANIDGWPEARRLETARALADWAESRPVR